MIKIIVIALVLGSTIPSSPVLARATNPSERPAQSAASWQYQAGYMTPRHNATDTNGF